MALKRCDYCGEWYTPSFSVDRDCGNEAIDQLGLGLLRQAGKGIARLAGKKNFCSKECREAWEAEHGPTLGTKIKNNMKKEMDPMMSEAKAEIGGVVSDMKNDMNDVVAETKVQMQPEANQMKTQLKDSFSKSLGEMKGAFGGIFGKKK
jgi:hypothetical protein